MVWLEVPHYQYNSVCRVSTASIIVLMIAKVSLKFMAYPSSGPPLSPDLLLALPAPAPLSVSLSDLT